MTMTNVQAVCLIFVVGLGTMLTRFLPFFLFPDNKPTPKIIHYLSSVLPYALIGVLAVYCLKNTSVTTAPYGLPELIAILTIVGLHVWKRKSLISIAGGTVVYMVLIQFVF